VWAGNLLARRQPQRNHHHALLILGRLRRQLHCLHRNTGPETPPHPTTTSPTTTSPTPSRSPTGGSAALATVVHCIGALEVALQALQVVRGHVVRLRLVHLHIYRHPSRVLGFPPPIFRQRLLVL